MTYTKEINRSALVRITKELSHWLRRTRSVFPVIATTS